MQLVLALVMLVLGYLVFWPIVLEPEAREMPSVPELTGVLEPNDRLSAVEFLPLPDNARGPEDIAVLDGVVMTTDLAGRLYRVEGDALVQVSNLGGRPLGLKSGTDGNLYIADSFRGILRWSPDDRLDLMADRVDGVPITYPNQLDVGRDGVIYFSSSTERFDPELLGGTLAASVMAIWEQSATGYVARLLPDGTTEKLADGLIFANGVALSPEEDYLLIAETGRARLIKLWLDEARFGTSEVVIDSLPGYPDNLEANGDGTYWLGLASPRLPSEALFPYPFLRKVIWRLGPWVPPAPVHHGRVLRVDGDGTILDMLEDPTGALGVTTGAQVVGEHLYVTSLDGPALGRLPAP